jgi:hypothetical protein
MVALTEPVSLPRQPRTTKWRPDAVSVLTLLIGSAFIIPARYTFPPLGGAGRLDIMLGVGMFAWWLVTRAVSSLTVRDRQPMRTVIGVLLVLLFVSAALAYQRGLSTIEFNGMDRELIGWVSIAGVALVAMDGIRSFERADVLLKRILLFGVFVAFVANVQFFFGFDLTYHLRPPGMRPNLDLLSVEFRSVVARVYGTSLHPIEFGVLMSVLGALSTHYALVARTRVERQWRWACTALLVGSGLLSVSRSAVVSMTIILLGYLYIWRPRLWFTSVAAAVAGLGVMRVIAPGLLGTLRALFEHYGEDPSIAGRTNDYDDAFSLVGDSFWFGRGPGTFNVEEYFLLDNQWLGQLVATGFVGTMALAVLFIAAIAQAHHLARRSRTDERRHLGHALMIILLVYVVTSFFFDSLAYPQITALTVVVIGTVGAMWTMAESADTPVVMWSSKRLFRSSRSMMGESGPAGGHLVEFGRRDDNSTGIRHE